MISCTGNDLVAGRTPDKPVVRRLDGTLVPRHPGDEDVAVSGRDPTHGL